MPTVMAFVDSYTAGYNRGLSDSNIDSHFGHNHGYAAGYAAGECGSSQQVNSPVQGQSQTAKSATCLDSDAGPIYVKGYNDAQKDFHALNGHGYDPSTSLEGNDRFDYQSGYQNGWADAAKGIGLDSTCYTG